MKMAPNGKKKKTPKNAFYFFMADFREQYEKRGKPIDSMQDMAEIAGQEWRQLSPEKRSYYEQVAADWKKKEKTNLENKYTTTGVSYAQLMREENERAEQHERMIAEIETSVRSLQWDSTLRDKNFHFVHVNSYCRLETGDYFPCEIGIAKFTFLGGITDSYHSIINQESVPLGYSYESKKTSEETHLIPLPPHDFGERDYARLFLQIRAFLVDSAEEFPPPLYTLQTNMEAVSNTLTSFSGDKDLFRVYPLSKLLFELRNACARGANTVGFPVQSLADRELEKDFFNFAPGISCDFHENTDACQYCSLSVVKRWCFLFASLGCPDLGIELIPGKHKPRDKSRSLPVLPPKDDYEKENDSPLRKARDNIPEKRSYRGRNRSHSKNNRMDTAEPLPITIIDHSKGAVLYSGTSSEKKRSGNGYRGDTNPRWNRKTSYDRKLKSESNYPESNKCTRSRSKEQMRHADRSENPNSMPSQNSLEPTAKKFEPNSRWSQISKKHPELHTRWSEPVQIPTERKKTAQGNEEKTTHIKEQRYPNGNPETGAIPRRNVNGSRPVPRSTQNAIPYAYHSTPYPISQDNMGIPPEHTPYHVVSHQSAFWVQPDYSYYPTHLSQVPQLFDEYRCQIESLPWVPSYAPVQQFHTYASEFPAYAMYPQSMNSMETAVTVPLVAPLPSSPPPPTTTTTTTTKVPPQSQIYLPTAVPGAGIGRGRGLVRQHARTSSPPAPGSSPPQVTARPKVGRGRGLSARLPAFDEC